MKKKGVFGMTSVQSFFAIILGVALLAYVIVVILSTLQSSNILPAASLSATVTNESTYVNATSYRLAKYNVAGFTSPTITQIVNTSNGVVVPTTNYSFNSGTYYLNYTSPMAWSSARVTYTYSYDSYSRASSQEILSNTSEGVSNFFSSINPVYAILAILVIILVLVVLVRVVTGGEGVGRKVPYNPQL